MKESGAETRPDGEHKDDAVASAAGPDPHLGYPCSISIVDHRDRCVGGTEEFRSIDADPGRVKVGCGLDHGFLSHNAWERASNRSGPREVSDQVGED